MTTMLFVAGSENALLAAGVAEAARCWLRAIGRPSAPIMLRDEGDHYYIELPADLSPDDLLSITNPFPIGRGKELIKRSDEQSTTMDEFDQIFDYRKEVEKAIIYRKLSNAERKSIMPDDVTVPSTLLPFYSAIVELGAEAAYNKLHRCWINCGNIAVFRAYLLFILESFGQVPNNISVAQDNYRTIAKNEKYKATFDEGRLQIVNPDCISGSNSSKANKVNDDNLNGFWLLEYLRYVGFFAIAVPISLSNGDRKTYLVQPSLIKFDLVSEILDEFRKIFWAKTSVKSDILASILFTKSFYLVYKNRLTTNKIQYILDLFQHKPIVTDLTHGFQVITYKLTGKYMGKKTYSMMNLAMINLPNWLTEVESVSQVDTVLAFLDEHIRVVRAIQSAKHEEGSEEFALLRRYRDFLSGSDPRVFFDFAARYGDYVMATRKQQRKIPQLTTERLGAIVEQLIGGKKLSPIIQKPGFRAFAKAVRQATIIAQQEHLLDRKNNLQGNLRYPFEIRYGLGHQLLQKAKYPSDFVKALNTFLHSFNEETMRVEERIAQKTLPDEKRNHRKRLRETSLDEIVALIDEYEDSELIGTMLVGYGYALDKKRTDGQQDESEASDVEKEEISGDIDAEDDER